MTSLDNLLGIPVKELTTFFSRLQEKPMRAKQVSRWIYQAGEEKFSLMTDLSKLLRAKLEEIAVVKAPDFIVEKLSTDGTIKWLADVGGGNAVETVFIPSTHRGTLCISSQVGCAVNCDFCSTGKQGFSRNLTSAEIIGQLWQAQRRLVGSLANDINSNRPITNIVMMGMGEPLLNYTQVIRAMQLMLDDHAYGLSRRRVTLSTSGVVPKIYQLARELPVALAISLHAVTNELRDRLVPLNRKYPIKELLSACHYYLEFSPRNCITFEYCMLDGVNDTLDDAKKVVSLTKEIPCKFNLIPFNPFTLVESIQKFRPSSDQRMKEFADVLLSAGKVVTVRKIRGQDIDAACGQLAGEVVDRTSLKRRQSLIQFLKPV